MNNKPLLAQARKGQSILVNENPQTLSIESTADPKDPWAAKTTKTFIGRLSHERSVVPQVGETPAGMSTNLQRFLTTTYDVDFLQANIIMTDSKGKKWKLGAIDPLEKFGGVYGYQYPLEEANG